MRAFLELFALCGIAIVQPTLDLLRRNSNDVFVPAGATRFQVVTVVALILFAAPAALSAVEVAVGLVAPRIRRFAHAALAGSIVGLIAFEALTHNSSVGDPVRIAIAAVVGFAGALLLLQFSAAGLFLRYLAFAPVVFAVLFILSGPISPLVLASKVESADVAIGKPNRVVMIVFDELPTQSLLDGTGQIDAELFPNFATLAADSTWYRNNTSVAPYTAVAVPALMSGKLPDNPKAISTAAEHPNTLFTLLGNEYRINAHENIEGLNPGGDAAGSGTLKGLVETAYDLWRGFVTDDPPQIPSEEEMLEREQPAMRHFASSLGSAPRNQLDYLHVLMPHYPWHLLPDGRSYTDVWAVRGLLGTWGGGPEVAAVGRQRHILQLQATDRRLGQIFDKLERLGVYDKSLIVVTADHGEGFTAFNPIRKATAENFSEVMWVPLFIKAPAQTTSKVDDRPAHSIDVLPTIADLLEIEIPWKTDGRSLLGKARPDGPRPFLKITSPDASTAPSDAQYQEWSGTKGFGRVLASRAASAGGDKALRVYKGFSAFGDLVGQPATPLVEPAAASLEGSISEPWKFATVVDPDANDATWTYLEGRVESKGGREIAISINGTIASITTTYDDVFSGGSAYVAVLPPSLFKPGANDIQMYVIIGTPAAPRLELVQQQS